MAKSFYVSDIDLQSCEIKPLREALPDEVKIFLQLEQEEENFLRDEEEL